MEYIFFIVVLKTRSFCADSTMHFYDLYIFGLYFFSVVRSFVLFLLLFAFSLRSLLKRIDTRETHNGFRGERTHAHESSGKLAILQINAMASNHNKI